MTVQECYESMGSDFEGVLGRMGSEAMVKRFALKFLDDPSYGNLVKAVEEQNAEEAFRAAHTLKGLCLNLGLEKLYKSAFEVTEALRGKTDETTPEMLEELKTNYESSVLAIKQL